MWLPHLISTSRSRYTYSCYLFHSGRSVNFARGQGIEQLCILCLFFPLANSCFYFTQLKPRISNWRVWMASTTRKTFPGQLWRWRSLPCWTASDPSKEGLRVPTGVTMACCSEGPNWSYHGMLLWVDRGVHAKFHATYVGGASDRVFVPWTSAFSDPHCSGGGWGGVVQWCISNKFECLRCSKVACPLRVLI